MGDVIAQKLQYRGTADIFIDEASGVEFVKDGEPQEVPTDRAEYITSLPGHDFDVVAIVTSTKESEAPAPAPKAPEAPAAPKAPASGSGAKGSN